MGRLINKMKPVRDSLIIWASTVEKNKTKPKNLPLELSKNFNYSFAQHVEWTCLRMKLLEENGNSLNGIGGQKSPWFEIYFLALSSELKPYRVRDRYSQEDLRIQTQVAYGLYPGFHREICLMQQQSSRHGSIMWLNWKDQAALKTTPVSYLTAVD